MILSIIWTILGICMKKSKAVVKLRLVCLLFDQLENFSITCRRHYYRWRAANFDLYLALTPHVLWHGASVYMAISEDPWNSCCRAFGSEAVTTCFCDLGLLQLGFEHPTFRMRGESSNRLRQIGGVVCVYFNAA